MLGQFVLQEFCLFLKCPLIQHQALSSRLDWLWMPLPNPHPALLPRVSSGWKGKGRSPIAFPSHPQLFIILKINSQSCAETFPEKCLTIPVVLLASPSPTEMNLGTRNIRGWLSWVPLMCCLNIHLFQVHPAFCAHSRDQLCAALKSGKTPTYSSLPLPCWQGRHCPGVWPHSEETVGPEELQMSQPGSWREYSSLKYCHGFWFILTAAHGLCSGFIWHLKLPEVPYAQNKNEWEGGLETDIFWAPSNPHHCDSDKNISKPLWFQCWNLPSTRWQSLSTLQQQTHLWVLLSFKTVSFPRSIYLLNKIPKDKQLFLEEALPSPSLPNWARLAAHKPSGVNTNEQTRQCQEISWQWRTWCWEYNEESYYSQSMPKQHSKCGGKLSHQRRHLF